ncbi:MAG: SDR family oxidoreductase [Bacteroidales bacterium]
MMMKILLTGATGYIAQRLLPALLREGHQVYCCVRDKDRFVSRYLSENVIVLETDFLREESLQVIPQDIDVAFYLIHSMSASGGDFSQKEKTCAINFRNRMQNTRVQQVIYLSGIVNDPALSRHLSSRKQVEDLLREGTYALTTLRAGIIVGSGSASFEIIRDLVEKLPVMIAPQWLNTRCQPIAIRNVIEFLSRVMARPETYHQDYDIGGDEILTYKQMLLRFAKIRGLKRRIFIVPVMTPKLSSYWLYFITSTSYPLAQNLVNSMKVEVICRPSNIASLLNIELIDYDTSIELAFDKIEQNDVLSSWKDAQTSDVLSKGLSSYMDVPVNGCLKDVRQCPVSHPEEVLERIWQIGGKTGWYYADWLWELRGVMDQMAGGVGVRRGRKSPDQLRAGQALDFWRVIVADKEQKRLLLYAEMKVPGEAWLEFVIHQDNILRQTATFRPLGLLGRLYWYSLWPIHTLIFQGMIRKIAGKNHPEAK